MITVRVSRCQTLCALTAAALCLLTGERATGNAEAPPTASEWRREIDAAHLLEGSLTLAPAKDAAEQEARHVQLQDLYRRLAEKYPREVAAQKATADFFTRDGLLDVALPYWEKASQLDPRDGDAADRLGGVYLGLGRTRAAYEQFQKAVDAQPEVATFHFDLANVLYLFRRDLLSPPIPGLADEQAALTQALGHFRRAAELAPTDLRLAKAYAETFYIFAMPDWTQALAAWEAVRALSGDQTDFSDSHLARISLRLGKPDAATEFLARIHDPSFDAMKAKLLQQAERQRASSKR